MHKESKEQTSYRIKNIIHKIFRKMGYEICRYTSNNFPSLKRMKIINSEKIDVVIDVGASEGFYVEELRDTGYMGRIISFEPLSQSFQILKKRAYGDSKWICINTAIGSNEGETEINVSGHITSSSLLSITEAHLNAMPSSAIISKEKVKIRTLDSLLYKVISPNERIFLKIDVQGFEMHVLKGAQKILTQVKAIELELSLTPLYNDAPSFIEMINYLDSLGFMIVSFSHVFSDPNSDQLLQVNGFFKKRRLKD